LKEEAFIFFITELSTASILNEVTAPIHDVCHISVACISALEIVANVKTSSLVNKTWGVLNKDITMTS